MLARYGITLPEFSEFINVALAGKVVSQVNEGGKIFDLTIKVADHDRDSMEEIGELMLDANGRKVPLHYVAEVLPYPGPTPSAGRMADNVRSSFLPMLPAGI